MTHCNRNRPDRDAADDHRRTFAVCMSQRRLRSAEAGPTPPPAPTSSEEAFVDHQPVRTHARAITRRGGQVRLQRGSACAEQTGPGRSDVRPLAPLVPVGRMPIDVDAEPGDLESDGTVIETTVIETTAVETTDVEGKCQGEAQAATTTQPGGTAEDRTDGDGTDTPTAGPKGTRRRRLGARGVRSARTAVAALASLAAHRSPLWRPRP